MLYRPEAFEPLTEQAWDDEAVRAAIRRIVAGVDDAFRGRALQWPVDAWDGWRMTSPLKGLYVGSAGVVWALDELRRRGLAETGLDLADVALAALERFRAYPDLARWPNLPTPAHAALLTGETGILLVLCRLSMDDHGCSRPSDDLLACVTQNLHNEANELMWGAPGTLFAANAMVAWTGEERWRDARDAGAQAVRAARDADGLWTQNVFGQEYRSLTPPHGLVGNVHALLPAVDATEAEQLRREAKAILARTAVVEDGLANWPALDRPTLPGPDGQIRLQWCAGAPGIVATAVDYVDEELVLAGAELVWRAGPHGADKGPGICHGTAGNGYALLKTFAHTGDERWLERARRFAMHALRQVDELGKARGRGRYSLWTGDVGVALYAADCLEARAAYPVLDYSA